MIKCFSEYIEQINESNYIDDVYMCAVEKSDFKLCKELVNNFVRKKWYDNKINNIILYKGFSSKEEFDKTSFCGYFTDDYDFSEHYSKCGSNGKSNVGEFFIYMKNPYVFDFKGGGSDGDFPGSDGVCRDTVDIIKKADEENRGTRYDGYVLYNVGEYCDEQSPTVDDYICKINKHIKRASPITFDDNGNVIPLSQRFDLNKDDNRY